MRSIVVRGSRAAASSALACTRADYTPIWAEPQAQDVLGEQRLADELDAISTKPSQTITSIGQAAERWIAFGNDPLLDCLRPGQSSVFLKAEDYMGTNLVDSTDRNRMRDSIHFWSQHYDKHFSMAMRQARRTALNHIGVLSATDSFEDEADRALTGWDRDLHFRELAYLSETILKTPVTNMQKFEQAVRNASPEMYLEFCDAIGQQTQTLIPLPSPSVWYYEGDARLAWCKSFKTAQAEATAFFQNTLGPAISSGSQQQGGTAVVDKWRTLAKQLAAVFTAVGQVQLVRLARQIASGMRKEWSTMTEEEKLAACYAELETFARGIAGAEFDAEDVQDKSVEWISEQQTINDLLNKPIEGFSPSITAEAFWKHTVRLDALETDYLITDHNKRLLAAKAWSVLYDQCSMQTIVAKTAESFEHGKIDLQAFSFIPWMNEVWCWRNYSKFGLSTPVHHTATAKRQLMYNFTDSTKMISAAAKLFYATRPLSSDINYASPALHRKSFVQLCASYGVDWMHSLQRTLLGQQLYLGLGEDAIRSCLNEALAPFRELRLRNQRAELATHAPTISALSAVRVVPLDGDGDETAWALGSKRLVSYKWDSPHIIHLQRNASLGDRESLINKLTLETRAGIEVSLWRKRSPEEIKTKQDKNLQASKDAAKLVHEHPSLSEVQKSAVQTASRLTGMSMLTAGSSSAADAAADLEWDFVTMIHDRHIINDTQSLEVTIPFRTLPNSSGARLAIPDGQYRLRLRAFDHDVNPSHSPVHFSECTSAEFQVFDCIPQVTEEIFGSATVTAFAGKDLVPFFTHLRAIHMDVSLSLEVEVGQHLSPKGEVLFDKFLELLKSGKYGGEGGATEGLTEPQLAAELKIRQHWALYNPAASEDEWYGVRRAVLDQAFDTEKEWWLEDEMLTGVNMNSMNLTPTVRYSNDICHCLSADGSSLTSSNPQRGTLLLRTQPPLARATYNGDGTLGDLTIDEKKVAEKNLSLEDVLAAAASAIDDAHLRLCTLSSSKQTDFRKLTQQYVMLLSGSSEFGGKYGRTYRDAFDKASAEIRLPKTENDELRKKEVDRFASETHPEQRRRLWTPRVNSFNQNLDDPTPDMKSNWGNTL